MTKKIAGYDECRKEVEKARLPEPIVFDPMIMIFDPKKLEDIRDKYGVDLYMAVMKDVEREDGQRMTA